MLRNHAIIGGVVSDSLLLSASAEAVEVFMGHCMEVHVIRLLVLVYRLNGDLVHMQNALET